MIGSHFGDSGVNNEPQHAPIPQQITDLEQVYFEHFDILVEAEKRLGWVTERLASISEHAYERIASEVQLSDFLFKDVGSYKDRVCFIADNLLSSPLAPFRSSQFDILAPEFRAVDNLYRYNHDTDREEFTRRARTACEACSPLKVWAALQSHHNPRAQNLQAAREHANVLGGQLLPHLYSRYGRYHQSESRPVEMKVVKGKVEICIHIYSEKDFNGRRRFNSGSMLRDFGKAVDFALRQTWPDKMLECGQRLFDLCGDYECDRRILVSRERINLGSGVEIVTGFQQFKLYLPQEIAAALNMFIAEYGEPPKDR